MRRTVLVTVMLLAIGGQAQAQQKNEDLIDERLGPEDFRMQGLPESICSDTVVNIPAIGSITATLEIPCPDSTIEDLDLLVQITHTWIGDLSATLTKQGSSSTTVFDRPGLPAQGPFGCSGDDIDAIINDEAADPIEDECEAAIPTIQGEFIGGDPPDATLMASWDGEDVCGTWELTVTDHAGGDSGFINQWCLISGPDTGDGGNVPATTGIGVLVAVLLLLGGGTYLARPIRGSRS